MALDLGRLFLAPFGAQAYDFPCTSHKLLFIQRPQEGSVSFCLGKLGERPVLSKFRRSETFCCKYDKQLNSKKHHHDQTGRTQPKPVLFAVCFDDTLSDHGAAHARGRGKTPHPPARNTALSNYDADTPPHC